MILPPFFGHKTPDNDGEPYRIHYSYIGGDIHTYENLPKTLSKHTYIGMDVITYKFKYLPPLLIHSYLSEDILTYKLRTFIRSVTLSYLAVDCLTFTPKPPPPSFPINIYADTGSSSSYLSWLEPYSQLPIIDYIIKYSLANPYSVMTENDHILRAENGEPIILENSQPFTESWILFKDKRNPQTNITVTGLINNNTYVFKIAAVSKAGRGDYGYSNNVTPHV